MLLLELSVRVFRSYDSVNLNLLLPLLLLKLGHLLDAEFLFFLVFNFLLFDSDVLHQ